MSNTNTYTKSITVTKEHLDDLNHVNNAIYVHWIQDIAAEHWQSITGEQHTKDYYWVVFEHHIKYKKQVFLNEELTVKTYVKSPEGIKSLRVVEFYRKDELVVRADTNWILVDANTHKPIRVPNVFLKLFGIKLKNLIVYC